MPDIARTHLPIPHRGHVGLVTYDAKDPGDGVSARSRPSVRPRARPTC